MTRVQFDVNLVRDNNGDIDVEGTLEGMRGSLLDYKTRRELEESTVKETIHGIYDENRGVVLTLDTIAGMVCLRLNAQTANYETIKNRALAFVRANLNETKDPETKVVVKNENSVFVIKRGSKGGGIVRRCDMAAKPEETK